MGEFEKYRATLSDYELLRSANCCRHAFEYQQSKIEGLEKKLNTVTDLLNNLKTERKDFKEFDPYDKGYRVAVGYIIQDLEKALRGEFYEND